MGYLIPFPRQDGLDGGQPAFVLIYWIMSQQIPAPQQLVVDVFRYICRHPAYAPVLVPQAAAQEGHVIRVKLMRQRQGCGFVMQGVDVAPEFACPGVSNLLAERHPATQAQHGDRSDNLAALPDIAARHENPVAGEARVLRSLLFGVNPDVGPDRLVHRIQYGIQEGQFRHGLVGRGKKQEAVLWLCAAVEHPGLAGLDVRLEQFGLGIGHRGSGCRSDIVVIHFHSCLLMKR